MNTNDYSYITWKIGGVWGSFTSSGLMRFACPTFVHFKEKTHYLNLSTLRGLYSNIIRGLKKGSIYTLSIKFHFADDLSEERKQKYLKAMDEYMEKYGIIAQEV